MPPTTRKKQPVVVAAVKPVPVPVVKPVPVPVAKVNVKLAPIPPQYRQLPEDLAREMMASDQRDLLRKGKKALAAGTVTGKGDIQQSTSKPSTRGGAGYIGVGGKKT